MAITAIVKPTHDCNFSCKYCYVDHNAEHGVMSEQTLENVVEQVIYTNSLLGGIASFIWHGGEPLTMPLSFYERVVELQRKHAISKFRNEVKRSNNKKYVYLGEFDFLKNSFQSNGSLLTDEIVEFCRKYNFDVGLSLDGPKHINDKTRQDRNGRGTFEDIMRGVKKAKEARIGGGVITILNKNNIGNVQEIYEFFKQEKINAKINPLIKSGNAIDNYQDLGITPKEYGTAMIKLFDLWFDDEENNIELNPFEEIIGNLLTGKVWGCNFSTSCQEHFVSIGPQGDVYPCGRFDGIKDFKLGNINHDNLLDMFRSETRTKLLVRRAESFKDCAKCNYKGICNAGCMHNAYMASGDIMTKDFYCTGYKMLFDHVGKRIKQEIKKTGGKIENAKYEIQTC